MARPLALAAALAVVGLPWASSANSIETEYPDNGARALGRAGAFTARADDPTAIYYNPAGLARQEGFSLLLSTNILSLTHTFDAADDFANRKARVLGGLEQSHPVSFGPMMAGHFDVEGLEGFDFGFGIYGPASTMKRSFADQIPVVSVGGMTGEDQNEVPVKWLRPNGMLVEAEMLLAYPTVSVAYELLDNLRIGLSFQIAVMQAKLSQAIGPPQEAMANLEFADWFTPTAILGLHYSPTPWLELGASIRPGFQVEAEGTMSLTQYRSNAVESAGDGNYYYPEDGASYTADGAPLELFDAAGRPDDGMTFVYNHPMVVRAAARFVQKRYDIELDYIFQQNSTHEYFEIDPGGESVTVAGNDFPVPTLRDQRDYEDTHEVRLGGDYALMPGRVNLRTGTAYATGASPDNKTNLDFPGLDRWSVHAGVGLIIEDLGLEVDFGYAYVGLVERTVTDSEATLIDVTKKYGQGEPIGNGTFAGHYHIGGVSVLWHVW
jgi:long-chain fatty acid transport protein